MSTVVRSTAFRASASFTPAANSHTAGDVVGAEAEFSFGSPARPAGHYLITSATLKIPDGTVKATAWRVHLYNVTPPSSLNDDDAFDIPAGDRASYLGYVDLGTAVDVGTTQWVETHGINKHIKLGNDDAIFGYLVNLSTITPAAVAHEVTLHLLEI